MTNGITFSLEEYTRQIEVAKNSGFTLDFRRKSSEKLLLMRHDIDLRLDCVLDFAELERHYDVRAIYCILASGSLYSLSDESSLRAIAAIEEMGHEIGLHFNPDPTNGMSFLDQINQIQSVIGKKINYFSQHQPSVYGFMDISMTDSYVNLYDLSFSGEFKYISDSCMLPRENFYELVSRFDRIQYLTHPEFWSLSAESLIDLEFKLKQSYHGQKDDEIELTIQKMQESVSRRDILDKFQI